MLVVDDEPFLRIAVRRWFERTGWQVIEASDGDHALELLAAPDARRPDVVVADRRMPRLDGLALHAALLEHHPALAARFILASGDPGEPALVAFARDTGCPIVAKPFQLPELGLLAAQVAELAPPA